MPILYKIIIGSKKPPTIKSKHLPIQKHKNQLKIINSNLAILDTKKKNKLVHLPDIHSGGISCLQQVASSSLFLSATDTGELALWQIDNCRLVQVLGCCDTSDTCGISCLKVLGNKRFCVSGGEDWILRIWDLNTRRLEKEIKEHDGKIIAIEIKDGFFFTADVDGIIVKWDENSFEKIKRIRPFESSMNIFDFVLLGTDEIALVPTALSVFVLDLKKPDNECIIHRILLQEEEFINKLVMKNDKCVWCSDKGNVYCCLPAATDQKFYWVENVGRTSIKCIDIDKNSGLLTYPTSENIISSQSFHDFIQKNK
jgi:hypothetical protein